MDKFNQKKIVALLAPIGLVVGMALSTQSIAMDNTYATDGAKSVLTNGAGECWRTVGGIPGPLEACGDEMPQPEAKMERPAPAVPAAPTDSDGDGVIDSQDRCPGTRAGAEVDQWGCEVVANLTINLVEDEFDFDSAELKPNMKAALEDLADQIKASQGHETLTIIGHTDSTGPEGYNMELSIRRAQAAADYLASMGIDSITVKGMGESKPVADNGTREGRAKNRRIEVITN
jgi:OOP family OmpA-OmpF porin